MPPIVRFYRITIEVVEFPLIEHWCGPVLVRAGAATSGEMPDPWLGPRRWIIEYPNQLPERTTNALNQTLKVGSNMGGRADPQRTPASRSRPPWGSGPMMHPVVEQLGDKHMLTNCSKWQLNVSAALEIGPGARDQILHREEDLFPYFPVPRPNLILASMWAISDFTVENGGTQLAPGSHRWTADRVAGPARSCEPRCQQGRRCSGSAAPCTVAGRT